MATSTIPDFAMPAPPAVPADHPLANAIQGIWWQVQLMGRDVKDVKDRQAALEATQKWMQGLIAILVAAVLGVQAVKP